MRDRDRRDSNDWEAENRQREFRNDLDDMFTDALTKPIPPGAQRMGKIMGGTLVVCVCLLLLGGTLKLFFMMIGID